MAIFNRSTPNFMHQIDRNNDHFDKFPNFFAKKWLKLPKIVITTLTLGVD
jgi:hypothetical protein